jgi:hypothetical protein
MESYFLVCFSYKIIVQTIFWFIEGIFGRIAAFLCIYSRPNDCESRQARGNGTLKIPKNILIMFTYPYKRDIKFYDSLVERDAGNVSGFMFFRSFES